MSCGGARAPRGNAAGRTTRRSPRARHPPPMTAPTATAPRAARPPPRRSPGTRPSSPPRRCHCSCHWGGGEGGGGEGTAGRRAAGPTRAPLRRCRPPRCRGHCTRPPHAATRHHHPTMTEETGALPSPPPRSPHRPWSAADLPGPHAIRTRRYLRRACPGASPAAPPRGRSRGARAASRTRSPCIGSADRPLRHPSRLLLLLLLAAARFPGRRGSP